MPRCLAGCDLKAAVVAVVCEEELQPGCASSRTRLLESVYPAPSGAESEVKVGGVI